MSDSFLDPDAPEPSAQPLDNELAAVRAQLADAEGRAAAARDAQLRAAADLDNTRRRLERDLSNGIKYAAERLLGELLSVCDSLELGLKAAEAPTPQVKALADGMQLTQRQLQALLEKNGVKVVDPKGEPFNPDAHQAMTMVESTDVPPNHVVAVMQKGYRHHDRLLRPAMVVVARAPGGPSA